MDITQFYTTFFDEADELLAEMEQALLGLDLCAPDAEQLNAIFRAAHSIKGGAATFGFTALTETTHLLENLLDRLRHGQLQLSAAMMDAFLNTKDELQTQLGQLRAGTEPEADRVAEICAVLQQLARENAEPEPPQAPPEAAAAPAPLTEARMQRLKLQFSRVDAAERKLLGQELALLGELEAQVEGEDTLGVWLHTACSAADLMAVCGFVVDEAQVSISGVEPAASAAAALPPAPVAASKAPPPAPKDASIRVDVAKVDQVINLVGELVITQAMLAQTAGSLDAVLHQRLLSGMGHLERNARDLQEAVMAIRMVPMDYVFSRFPRLIRDLSAKLGKQVALETEGSQTELDKGLIERIVDPLTHLVRNSLDHGIESPERRLAAGKDATGRLVLAARHQGGSIVIEVRDDGAGLSRERILAKAQAQGLAASASMPDEELWQLIFAAGFSTAEQVTDVSGRGVGMDVVRRNIQEMGGHVEIASQAGRGTTVRIVLPLTLAILNGMAVRVGPEVYILPLSSVIESLQPRAADIHALSAGQTVLHVRGEYLALVSLAQFFGVAGALADATQGIAVIVQAEGERYALLVDQLLGQHQVVVKNLETNYRRVPGISAATILGDGNVALIIDVAACGRRR